MDERLRAKRVASKHACKFDYWFHGARVEKSGRVNAVVSGRVPRNVAWNFCGSDVLRSVIFFPPSVSSARYEISRLFIYLSRRRRRRAVDACTRANSGRIKAPARVYNEHNGWDKCISASSEHLNGIEQRNVRVELPLCAQSQFARPK